MYSCSRNAQVTFVKKPQLKILDQTKLLRVTVVNLALFLNGGSLEITMTVPLMRQKNFIVSL